MPNFTINVNGTNYTVGYDGTFNSPQGLLPALNNLGFGIFWIEEIGGSYVLTTVDNDDVYGDAETNADPTTTTTTTTTTLGPITWTSTPSCAGDGLNGTGVITVSGITGGSGTYLYAGIGDSEANAAADVLNPATRTDITGPNVQFTGLLNDIYYIAIEDSVGGLHFSTQINVSCNNTTTTTTTIVPTTTTTTTTTSTTSTTTTAAPTTSTTTTTTTPSGPTTTSTTTTTTTLFAQTVTYASFQVDACLNPIGSQNVTGNSTDFCSCTVFNSAGFITVPSGNYVLAYNGNTLNVTIAGAPSTTAIVYSGGCGVCPLSTTTTTTSTTLQQVWYQMTNCNGGGTVYSQQNNIGYAEINDRVFGVVSGVPSNLVVTNVLFSEPVGATLVAIINSGQTGCPSTSTTTTTTSLAVVTLSTTPSCVGGGFNGNGRIVADSFAGGSGTYQYAGIGTSEANAISAAINPATRVNITGSSVTFNSLTNANYWVAIVDSLGNIGISAQTAVSCNATTTTSTTTTTTTALPTFVWNTNSAAVSALAACSAPNVEYVWTYGNAWGAGIVFYAGTAVAPTTPLQPFLGGGFFYENGGQVINIDDNGVSSNLQACPVLTSTTTTTTTAAFDYYFADEVDCFNSCSSISADVLVKFVGGSIVTLNKYYKNTANNRVYLLNSTATEGTAEQLNPLLYNDCGSACSGITTTTTTTTAAPTTSTTTTTTTATPTTTSTTTTTTTLAGVGFGVSLNTKYGTDFLACTGTVTGVVYQKAQFGNTPTVGAQLYTSSTTGAGTEWTPSQGIGLYLMQFGGSTKWSVLVGNTGLVNTVTSCVGVSTTTTTTTLPPITVSATPSCDGSGFSGQGRVTASSFSGGSGSYTLAAIGTSEANAIACINNAGCAQRVSIVGLTSYAWTSLANGPYYVAIRDTAGGLGLSSVATVSCNATTTTTSTTTSTSSTTTSTSSTTTSSTTTTTTLAPTFVWNTNSAAVSAQAACSATKDVYVWTFGNAWGAGIVFYAGTAGAPLQPIQPYLGGGFFYENGGQVINIDDNGVSSNLQACPTTTTTTPAPTFSQYLDCANNPYYTYNTNIGNGTSSEVVDNCVFYQGETSSPSGTFFTDFTAGGGCACP